MTTLSGTHLPVVDRDGARTASAAAMLSTSKASARARSRGGLRFTEWLVIGALCVAYIESISMPLFGFQLNLGLLNHFPLVLLLPVLLLHLAGVLFNRHPPGWPRVFAACWPLFLAGAYALVGSMFAKWMFRVNDSYLAYGLYLMLLPFYIVLTADGERPRRWAAALLTIAIGASLAALAGEVARFGTKETLHEIEYLITAGFVMLFYAARHGTAKAAALLLMIAAALVNQKLTGYLCALVALFYIGGVAGWRRLAPQWRGFYSISGTLAMMALAALLALLYFAFREYLPSGNVDVRLKQYEQAMLQFFDSPIWGNAYLSGSGELFRESFRALYIPTHSDILDMLKHGGLIGFSLFALGYWKLGVLIHRAIGVTHGDHLVHAYLLGARYFQIAALLTFAFNPLLLKGPFLIVIWSTLGLATGMALGALKHRPLDAR